MLFTISRGNAASKSDNFAKLTAIRLASSFGAVAARLAL
jgi:hypothetical protein